MKVVKLISKGVVLSAMVSVTMANEIRVDIHKGTPSRMMSNFVDCAYNPVGGIVLNARETHKSGKVRASCLSNVIFRLPELGVNPCVRKINNTSPYNHVGINVPSNIKSCNDINIKLGQKATYNAHVDNKSNIKLPAVSMKFYDKKIDGSCIAGSMIGATSTNNIDAGNLRQFNALDVIGKAYCVRTTVEFDDYHICDVNHMVAGDTRNIKIEVLHPERQDCSSIKISNHK
jgi:hypothetical protein